MSVSLLPTPRLQFTDINGAPLVGGTISTYIPSTLTPTDTWQDPAGTILNSNPIVLDALGSASIWGTGDYRFIVQDALGNAIFDAVTSAPALEADVLLRANNLSDVDSAATSRTNLGLGTAATDNTGTSGSTIPLLNGINTWAAAQTFSSIAAFNGGANMNIAAVPGITAIGFLGVPQGPLGGNYTLVMTDAGQEKFFTATASATIPPSSGVAFPIGTVIELTADATFVLTVLQGAGVTLRLPAGNLTGTRTVTGPGWVVIQKKKTDEWWLVGGSGIT